MIQKRVKVAVRCGINHTNTKYYKYFTNSIQKLCQIHYIQLITRLLVVNNIRNFSKEEDCVLKCLLNTPLNWVFKFIRLVCLHGKLLNVLLPAYYVLFWECEGLFVNIMEIFFWNGIKIHWLYWEIFCDMKHSIFIYPLEYLAECNFILKCEWENKCKVMATVRQPATLCAQWFLCSWKLLDDCIISCFFTFHLHIEQFYIILKCVILMKMDVKLPNSIKGSLYNNGKRIQLLQYWNLMQNMNVVSIWLILF